MARNTEVTRQWRILLEIEASRRGTIHGLARKFGVSTRTIRRDLDALQEAGFPLMDVQGESGVYWKLMSQPFRVVHDAGLSLQELCAFYVSREFVESLAGPVFSKNLKGGFDKVTAALPPRMKDFLDKIPAVLAVRPEPGRWHPTPASQAHVDTLLQAALAHRQVRMTYHSFSSRRVKDYVIDPYRLAYAMGCLYLLAYVPEYKEMRTFAVQRIKKVSPTEETFKPTANASDKTLRNSLGVGSGKAELVEIAFAPSAAPYIRERDWDGSQSIRECGDGSIVLSMKICVDWALQAWVLSFGPYARVVKPSRFAEQILARIKLAQEQYEPRMSFEKVEREADFSAQGVFPFPDVVV